MKRHILFSTLVAMTLAGTAVAQDFDTNPVIKYENKEQKVKFTVGARFMADAAYYHTDFTPLKSGVAITDSRIRTSMTYDNWYFYADFDFSKGKFSQKNIFLQYTLKDTDMWNHSFKAGYYNNPSTMANNTSRGSLHFISRAASSNALSAGRELGVSYKAYNNNFFFAEKVDLPAYEEVEFKMPATVISGAATDALMLILDFGGCQAGTNVTVSDIVLQKTVE